MAAPPNASTAATQNRELSRSIPSAKAKSPVSTGSVPKSSATVVAVVSLIAYTNESWFRKIPITAARTRIQRSRRRSENDLSRAHVTPLKSNAAPLKRSAPYAIGSKPCEITYFVTVKFSAQSVTVASSIRSATSGRRISLNLPSRLLPCRSPG